MLNPDYPDYSEDQYIGICPDLQNELQRRVKFHYTMYLAPDGKYGVQNQNTKEWSGLIGQVIKGVHIIYIIAIKLWGGHNIFATLSEKNVIRKRNLHIH